MCVFDDNRAKRVLPKNKFAAGGSGKLELSLSLINRCYICSFKEWRTEKVEKVRVSGKCLVESGKTGGSEMFGKSLVVGCKSCDICSLA